MFPNVLKVQSTNSTNNAPANTQPQPHQPNQPQHPQQHHTGGGGGGSGGLIAAAGFMPSSVADNSGILNLASDSSSSSSNNAFAPPTLNGGTTLADGSAIAVGGMDDDTGLSDAAIDAMADAALGTSFPSPELREVNWVPNNLAQSCYGCHIHFSFYRGKHHCRRCGNIFCGNCSNKKIAMRK